MPDTPKLSSVCVAQFWLAHQNETPERFGVIGTMYDQDYLRSAGGKLEAHVYDSSSPPNTGGPGYDDRSRADRIGDDVLQS